MKEKSPYGEDKDQIRELLIQYDNLVKGLSYSFIEEDSFEKIIDHFQENENLAKAMEAASFGCNQYPYSCPLLVKKADILLSSRKYQEALDILEQCILLDGHDINIYILKTEAYLALDQQENAVNLLEESLSLFEGEERIELLFELSDVYDDYEDFDKVFDCLKLILTEEPNNEEALYKICFWTDFTGRNEESIRLHKHIIDDYPYNELAWFNLAAAYQGLKLYEKAIDAYQYAIAIDDKFDYAYRNMGDAYIRLRKYKEAIEVLQKVNELAKPEDVILEAIGHCYDRMKKFGQARLYYRKASHMRPDDSKLYYKIACTYFSEQQWSGCLKQLELALRIHPKQVEYNLLAGECKVYLGKYKEALQLFDTVVRSRPRNASGWEALIRCYFKAELFEEAAEQAQVALKFTGNKPLFVYYYAASLFGCGKAKEAIIQLEKALELSPKKLKQFIDLIPSVLQNQKVVDLLARFKRNKSI
ncbi:MAG TPA: tetratricopeptide repeat protein [Chitinophagaceae bacterium]|nr:tetratricopeptide repeat protein [Chitinophagaceae bacterium]MCB9056876.1 tetratricopeptide repeat protein [Chitinophagales bacterium]HPG11220.1 tetratricopeptide repeat protein [Chitinophagaceae bacterium]HRX92949.1 tetratricopeptide repeat protein [Chitinophagaceae bacterium]